MCDTIVPSTIATKKVVEIDQQSFARELPKFAFLFPSLYTLARVHPLKSFTGTRKTQALVSHLNLGFLAESFDGREDNSEDRRVQGSAFNRPQEQQRVESTKLCFHPQTELLLEDY